MFDFLSNTFSSIFSQLTQKGTISESDLTSVLEQVTDVLLEADVPYELVETFVNSIKKEIVGQKIVASLKPSEKFAKVVQDTLVGFLGGKQQDVFSFQFPCVVMVIGLQGSGKTTTIGKLAQHVCKEAQKHNKGRNVLLASVDYYRPAAIDQLEILARKVGVDFYCAQSTDPIQAAQEIYSYFKQKRFDILFLDTAGRLHIDNDMLDELRTIDTLLQPKYKLLVLDAMTGQESLNVAKAFDQTVGFCGAILTKMDSDTRGGAAFSFRYAIEKPILFVGTGEKMDELSQFYPERAANRIIGMGDLQTLAEKAQEKINQSEQDQMHNAFMKGRITLMDFAQQLSMMNRLGSLSQLMKFMPGMGSAKMTPDVLQKGEDELKKFRAIISSMTPKERLNEHILNGLRKQRVARGAGVKVQDVNLLLERFKQAQEYVKLFKKFGRFSNRF